MQKYAVDKRRRMYLNSQDFATPCPEAKSILSPSSILKILSASV